MIGPTDLFHPSPALRMDEYRAIFSLRWDQTRNSVVLKLVVSMHELQTVLLKRIRNLDI
jgi:hypothetical protein